MGERPSVAAGRLVIPRHWPKWKLRCHARSIEKQRQCKNWCVMGMPTCRYHGSGGERYRAIGQLRYLAWVIIGGPQVGMPAEAWCRVALATAFEMLIKQGKGNPKQQMQAALWLTELLT